jgi:hypothetical protein
MRFRTVKKQPRSGEEAEAVFLAGLRFDMAVLATAENASVFRFRGRSPGRRSSTSLVTAPKIYLNC